MLISVNGNESLTCWQELSMFPFLLMTACIKKASQIARIFCKSHKITNSIHTTHYLRPAAPPTSALGNRI